MYFIILSAVFVSALSLSPLQDRAKHLLDHPAELKALFIEHKISSGQSRLRGLLQHIHEDSISRSNNSAPKHILTLLTDDQGNADVGYNDATFFTPTLDFFANNGVKFTSFYTHSICSPTRAALLTGRHASRSGLHDFPILPGETRGLPLEAKLLPQYLQESRFVTYLIGKWHLGASQLRQTPNYRGYDYFFGILGAAVDHYSKELGSACGTHENRFLPAFCDNCTYQSAYDLQENGVPYVDTDRFLGDILADKAVAAINAHDSAKSMLLQFHHTAPHTPLQAPQEYFDLCDHVSNAPRAFQPYFRQRICAMMVAVDINLLQVILALVYRDMFKSTLFLFHSDNGGFLPAGSLNSPYKGSKGSVYEGGVRVPAVMYGNGLHSVSHRVIDDLVHVTDVTPTLLGYAGALSDHTCTEFDGINHWPKLSQGLPLVRRQVRIESSSRAMAYTAAYVHIIDGQRWKYLYNPNAMHYIFSRNTSIDLYKHEGEFLYNLSDDPLENNNLIQSPIDRVQEIANALRYEVNVHRSEVAVPSQLLGYPFVYQHSPSPGGCWLPSDSPHYISFKCPASPRPVPDANRRRVAYRDYGQTAESLNNAGKLILDKELSDIPDF